MALDFAGITSAIDITTIVLAITAVAAIKILPGVARWGFEKVVSWFSSDSHGLTRQERNELADYMGIKRK